MMLAYCAAANSDGILSLKEQGFKQYKEHVFDSFQQHARMCILNAIEKERNGKQPRPSLMWYCARPVRSYRVSPTVC